MMSISISMSLYRSAVQKSKSRARYNVAVTGIHPSEELIAGLGSLSITDGISEKDIQIN